MDTLPAVQTKHRRITILAWSFLCSFVILLICSKSSPLYPMNDWVDVQCFFTVGRGITQGKMPYLDLYEQKGPVLYLLFAAASLISSDSFLGVFVLETVCFGLFLYESAQIAAVFVKKRQELLFLLPPAAALGIAVSPAFSHGSSAEELFLPVIALFLRTALAALEENRPLKRRECFCCGLLAGLALWTKYTFCGVYAGGAAALLVWYLATGNRKRLWEPVVFSLLGAAAVTLPVVLWFRLRDALPSLWEAYFVNNLTAYASGTGARHDPPITALVNNWMWSLPAALGSLWLILRIRKNWGQALLILASAAVLGVFTYANGRTYPYYALILSAFCCIGWAAVLRLLERILTDMTAVRHTATSAAASLILLTVCATAAYRFGGNVYLMQYEKEDMPQYRFARIISQEEDPSLLNLGFLDGGFYLASGVEPDSRFFCTFNMSLAEQDAEHDSLLKNGGVQFVVVRGKKSPGKNYERVDQSSFPFEGRSWSYTLYKRTGPE